MLTQALGDSDYSVREAAQKALVQLLVANDMTWGGKQIDVLIRVLGNTHYGYGWIYMRI